MQWYPFHSLLDNCGIFWRRFSSPIPWIKERRSIVWYFIHFLTILFDQDTDHYNPNDAEDQEEDGYHSDHNVHP